jgi:hypothetical protein
VFEVKYCCICAKKKHVDDVQGYCVNSSTFLLDAIKNHLKFNYGNHGFPHENQVLIQLKMTRNKIVITTFVVMQRRHFKYW